MYKNQLQELAQRSSYNLPSYSCIREGPDHAPRFKSTVNFNGETFESPGFFSTLRQAEHAAAEVALNSLSKRGPSKELACKILDETGVCKNLLQETAQRAGVCLPTYTTVRSGPGHLPVFTCTVEVAGMQFSGEPAKTKKQAEKNAAMVAWTALKKYAAKVNQGSEEKGTELEQTSVARALVSAQAKENRAMSKSDSYLPLSLPQRSPHNRGDYGSHSFNRGLPGPPPIYRPQHVTHSWAGVPDRQEQVHYGDSSYGADMYLLTQGMSDSHLPPHPSGRPSLPRHTSISIKPGMAYQPVMSSPHHGESSSRMESQFQPRMRQVPSAPVSRGLPALPNRNSAPKLTLLDQDDEDDAWLRGEFRERKVEREWPVSDPYWRSSSSMHSNMPHSGSGSLSPMIRTLVPVHASPDRRQQEEEYSEEEVARQLLSKLNL